MKTAAGVFTVASAAPPERVPGSVALTLILERGDGIEKFALRCRIAAGLIGDAVADSAEKLIERIAPWLEREFEQTREAALKSIRADRRVLEISFDAAHPGPF